MISLSSRAYLISVLRQYKKFTSTSIMQSDNNQRVSMMPESLIIPEKLPLQRLKSNESTTSSTFSRNSSSSSVATSISTTAHSPIQFKHSPLSPSLTSLTEALQLSFSKPVDHHSTTTTSTAAPPTTTPTNEPVQLEKWCIILVGLPASGKSSITANLMNSLKPNVHIDTFNAGFIRRKLSNFENQDSKFFDFNNPEGKKQRDLYATISLDHLLNSLIVDNLDIGILDATNSTRERRDYIFNTIKEKNSSSGIKINTMVLEIKCEDQKCWEYNARAKTKGPDYAKMGYDVALKDFINRAHKYRDAFEEITKDEMIKDGGVFITLKDVGRANIEKFGVENIDHDDQVFEMIMKFIDCYYEEFGKDYLDLVYNDV